MTKRLLALTVLALSAACSSSSAPGMLAHGIVGGQNQTVVAGAARLGDAVVEGIARTSDGKIVMRRVDTDRLLDFVVPRAFAQTPITVKGSPVPGAVVCVGSAEGLTPFVPCTNTNGQGLATFFFTPSNKAGVHTAEIRGTVNDQPAVFDTARATVIAAAADPSLQWNFTGGPSPYTMQASWIGDVYQNAVPFRIVSDGRLSVKDTVLGSSDARTVVFTDAMRDTLWRVVDIVGSGDKLVAHGKYRLQINNDRTEIFWRLYGAGLAVPP